MFARSGSNSEAPVSEIVTVDVLFYKFKHRRGSVKPLVFSREAYRDHQLFSSLVYFFL